MATEPAAPSFDVDGVVQVRTVVDGVITESYGGRIPGRPAWIWQESWDQCRHPQPVEVTMLRFIPAAAVDALLSRTGTPRREDIEALATTTCTLAAGTDRFFTYAVFQTPPLMPTMWSLIENTRSAIPGGDAPAGMTMVARQVVGSMGGVVTTTQIAWPAEGPARTVWQTSTALRPGFPVPDALLGQIIPQAKAPPRRLLLEALQARAAGEATATR